LILASSYNAAFQVNKVTCTLTQKGDHMIEFTHDSTKYKVNPKNAQAYRAALVKPKKHKPVALSTKNLARQYPAFQIGMSTAEYVAQFNGLNSRLMHHGIEHSCENYHKPAPMLDASIPECVEDVNPDYVPEFLNKPKKPAQTVAGLKKTIRAALDALATGDTDTAQCLLNESLKL
jgi:hypothetical protein